MTKYTIAIGDKIIVRRRGFKLTPISYKSKKGAQKYISKQGSYAGAYRIQEG